MTPEERKKARDKRITEKARQSAKMGRPHINPPIQHAFVFVGNYTAQEIIDFAEYLESNNQPSDGTAIYPFATLYRGRVIATKNKRVQVWRVIHNA